MKVLDVNRDQSKIELSHDDLLIMNSALNEICNGIALFEFETRIGAGRDQATELMRELSDVLDKMEALKS